MQEKLFDEVLNRAKNAKNLNAFITLGFEVNSDRSIKGRLSGMVIAVKDNIHVKGLPNSAGTQALKDFIPQEDASIIKRLKKEGVQIVGKTNMHELAFGITSNNAFFGAVKNPYNTDCIPGGSSGGSAVAVASRIVPAAIGTDTGASVRLPAGLTGIIGFRPSVGRYPSDGITPISHTRDVPGPMALTMDHITLLDSVMSGLPEVKEAKPTSEIRLGVVREPFYQNLHPETETVMQEALSKIKDAGVTLVEFDMNEISTLNELSSFPIAIYEGHKDLEAYLEAYNTGITFKDVAEGTQSPDVRKLFTEMAMDKNNDGVSDGAMPQELYDAAINVHRVALMAAYKSYFDTHEIDALVFPTSILPAVHIEGSVETINHNGAVVPTFPTYIQNVDPASNAGLPGISIPIGMTSNGLPIGLELDGRIDEDDNLLSVARAVEKLFGPLSPPSNSQLNAQS